MKHLGKKYKRFVSLGLANCAGNCELHPCSFAMSSKCVNMDFKKRNIGYYKEKKA